MVNRLCGGNAFEIIKRSARISIALWLRFEMEESMSYSIAIDGPAGAGKSTIAKLLAADMNYIYVDTGAMYRAMAVYFSQNKVNPDDEAAINATVENVDITIEYADGVQQVILNGENVTSLLRTEETGKMASKTSKYAAVRTKLVDLQRKLAATTDVIMDGRDIGTTVLPNAFVKIFLTASSDARAKRRFDELEAKGEKCDYNVIKEDIEKRDYEDSHREISPLKQAEDAVLLDTSDMTIDEVVNAIKAIIDEKKNSSPKAREVILAKSAGFCFGVHRAVDMVYEQTDRKNVYTFGPIIHNEEVVKDLENKGVRVINSLDELGALENGTIIIRSHGVSKSVYDTLESNGMEIVDATCPFVRKIHKIVKEESENGKQIIIIGNENHPEVEGIRGWSVTPTIVIDTLEKAEELAVDSDKEICIVSQTTFNYNKFKELVEIISKKGYNVIIRNTICNATEERQTEAREIAKRADAMIVVGGSSSSNTRKLYEICKNECDNTFYIQTLNDLELSALNMANCIGITAGASTPNNIIEEVYTNVRAEFSGDVR